MVFIKCGGFGRLTKLALRQLSIRHVTGFRIAKSRETDRRT